MLPLANKAQERHHQEYEEADYDVHQSVVDDFA
jgi:hypothetical protein